MMNELELQKRDAGRDIGSELLESIRALKKGQGARTVRMESKRDGSVTRTITSAAGQVIKQEVLTGDRWELIAVRSNINFSQEDFAQLLGVNKRTLENWEQGRSPVNPSARTLVRLFASEPSLVKTVMAINGAASLASK